MRSASICGSDLGFYDYTAAYQKFAAVPVIMGHEFSGEVEDVGRNVTDYKRGDRVSCESIIYCGRCEFCRSGRTNICRDFKVFGMHRNGGFAELVSANQKLLHRLPDGIGFIEAGVVEPLSVTVNAVEDVARQGLIENTVVIGPGPLGLFSSEVLRARGSSKNMVIGVNVDELRLGIAKKLGFETINSEADDVAAMTKEVTNGEGFDLVVVAAGAPAAMKSAMSLVKKGGQVVVLGIFPEEVSIPLSDAVRKQVSISGSYGSSWPHYERAISLLSNRQVRVGEIVTHRFGLDEAKEAFETAKSKKGCKVQFKA